MGLGQTPNFTTGSDLLAYCAENPTLEAGYAPGGEVQVLPCEEWPYVLPPMVVTVSGAATSTTTSTCLQLFGSTEPCIGPIGQYTLLVLIALGFGIFWWAGRRG